MTRSSSGLAVPLSSRTRTSSSTLACMTLPEPEPAPAPGLVKPAGWSKSTIALRLVKVLCFLRSGEAQTTANGVNENRLPSFSRRLFPAYIQKPRLLL